MDLVAVPRTRWAPSPRAQRLACQRRERSISAFTRVFDALWERVGVIGARLGMRSSSRIVFSADAEVHTSGDAVAGTIGEWLSTATAHEPRQECWRGPVS